MPVAGVVLHYFLEDLGVAPRMVRFFRGAGELSIGIWSKSETSRSTSGMTKGVDDAVSMVFGIFFIASLSRRGKLHQRHQYDCILAGANTE